MFGWRLARVLKLIRFAIGCGLVVLLSTPAQADEVVDQLMMRTPDFPLPRVIRRFPDRISELWSEALQRPEAELRREAALAIIKAHQQGMLGLETKIPVLMTEVVRKDQNHGVLIAVVKALIELNAKESAEVLYQAISRQNADLCEIIEPALAKWKFSPVKADWLKKIEQNKDFQRPVIRAIQCLGEAEEPKAIPRLREIIMNRETPPHVRLAASKSLGFLRKTGGESDSIKLASETSPLAWNHRVAAAWLLRHHSGKEAIDLMLQLSRDSESVVATIALNRLIELDPAHVEKDLKSHLNNKDANVRSLAVDVLYKRACVEYVTLLADRLSDHHPDVRSKSRRYMRELANRFKNEVINEGTRVLSADDWRGKEQASYLLTQLDHKPAVDRLIQLLRDERPEAAIAAAWGLRVLAVPTTYPKVLQHIQQHYVKGMIPEWRDQQISQLVQLLGYAKYQPAHDTFKSIVPPREPSIGFVQTRAAAAWALGFLYEGKPNAEIGAMLNARINAIMPTDVEHEIVRTMCIVSLGRMKQVDKLETLRRFFAVKKPSFYIVSNACGWSIEQLTGEKMPAPGIEEASSLLWFLIPAE